MSEARKEHWEDIYRAKRPDEVSWFQDAPEMSLRLITEAGLLKDAKIIDVGGGASRLVDALLAAGFVQPTVLDISAQALEHSKRRLASSAPVRWIEADITAFAPPETYDLWHDRAVFHFMTDEADRRKYIDCVGKALKPGGFLILATFALDGPEKCSGLPVRRYDAASLLNALGPEYSMIREADERHRTPWDTEQHFIYFMLRRNVGLEK